MMRFLYSKLLTFNIRNNNKLEIKISNLQIIKNLKRRLKSNI